MGFTIVFTIHSFDPVWSLDGQYAGYGTAECAYFLLDKMELESYSTITLEQARVLTERLAQGEMPVIDRFEPVADFEELSTFAAEKPTPVFRGDRDPVWRVESVAARLVEAFAIASHETLSGKDWEVLAGIIVEHAEYLYTFHNSAQRRSRLEAGTVLALAGCCCHVIPQAAAWRFAGFARIAEAAESASPSYLVELVDAPFEAAVAFKLPVLDEAIEAYNAAFSRDLRPESLERHSLTDAEFFERLDLDGEGLEGVKAELAIGNVERGRSAYEAFLRRRGCDSELYRVWKEYGGSEASRFAEFSFGSAKSCLERARRLSAQTESCGSGITVQTVSETSDIGTAALVYPEWRDNEQLLALAMRRSSWIVHTRFFPDGCHVNGLTRSQHEEFAHFWRFYRLEKLGGVQFAPEFGAQVERILEAFIYLSQPDYCLPDPGDGDRSETGAAKTCALGIEEFDREDLRYIVSEGMEGEPPKETSHAFPYAGYCVMRNSWRPEAQYLLFNAGHRRERGRPFGDKLSFLLYAHGRRLIVAPGIVGASNGVGMEESVYVPDPDTRWMSTPSFDFAEGWYKGGYGDDCDDAVTRDLVHKRSIFYVRGEYFILHDLVLGEGEHRLEQNFHLAPGCAERLEGGILRTMDPNSGNIVIAPTDADGPEVALGNGETSPQELVYAMDRQLPTTMNVVLFPLAPGAEVSPEIGLIEVIADADVLATGCSMGHGEFTDFVLISDDGFAEMCTSELEFRGEYAFLRVDKKGRPLWCGLINGQFLGWRGEVLVDLPEAKKQWLVDLYRAPYSAA